MREREAMQKLRSKENADKARGVHPSTIDEGDLVLLQNLTPQNKIEPRFEIQPHKVIQRDGSAVLIENEEKGMKLGNTSQMKKYVNKPIENETLTTEQTQDKTMYDEKSDVTNKSAESVHSLGDLPTYNPISSTTGPIERPHRIIKPPVKFKDYVTK